MEREAVRFEEIWRSYGSYQALRGLTFGVPQGSITALLGQNGTGKTTALKCLLGLLRADRGHMFLFGQPAESADPTLRQRVGYLSERQMLDPRLTVGEVLEFNRVFYDRWDHGLEEELLQRLQLHRGAFLAALSRGQLRKVGLVLALASRPELLVLDEPAANLDVVIRRQFLETVLDLFRTEGMTVLLSTHLLTDVERIADHVVFLEEGRCRLAANLDDLKDSVKTLRVVPGNGTPVPDVRVPGVLTSRRMGGELLLTVEGFDAALLDAVREQSHGEVEVRNLPLEDIFLAYAAADREGL